MRNELYFLEDLKCCKNLVDLHKWAAGYDIELRRYSRLAFRQLHDSGQSLNTLIQALGDKSLNNADNLDFFLRKLKPLLLAGTNIGAVTRWFQQTLALGQWSGAQLSLVIKFISRISTERGTLHVVHSLTAAMLDGLKSSTIVGHEDWSDRELGLLLEAVTRHGYTRSSQDLGLQILKTLGPTSWPFTAKSISVFFQKAMEAKASNGMLGSENSIESIPRFFEILWTLPRTSAFAVMYKISKHLVRYTTCLPESNIPLLRLLDDWWVFIRYPDSVMTLDQGSDRRKLERLLIGKPLIIIATYLRPLDDFTIANFILRRILMVNLSNADQNRASKLFCELHGSECHNARYSPYVRMMRAAHTFSEVSEHMTRRVFRLLQMLQKSTHIRNIINGLRNDNIIIRERLTSGVIREDLNFRNHKAESIFYAARELPLENCPELAENMITNLIRPPDEALKCYLSRHPWRSPGCRENPNVLRARAQLLQRMALAYSTTKRISSRMAFRWVYKCYILHMDEHLGQLHSSMVVALTRTGVIRPLEEGKWVSTMRLRWILKLINKFESPETAEQVDQAVYKWRGFVVRKIQEDYHQRKMARHGRKEEPLRFRAQNIWSHHNTTGARLYGPREFVDKARN